jgi:hypothetical protein
MKISNLKYNIITKLNVPVYQFSSDIGELSTVYVLVFKDAGILTTEKCFTSSNNKDDIEVTVHNYRLIKI